MKALFVTNKRYLTDKNTLSKCRGCNRPLFISMFEGHFVYLVIQTKEDFFKSSDLLNQVKKSFNQRRKYCVNCCYRYSRIKNLEKYYGEFVKLRDNTARVSKRLLVNYN